MAQHDHPILRSGAEPRSRGRADGAAYSDRGDSGDFSWVLCIVIRVWALVLAYMPIRVCDCSSGYRGFRRSTQDAHSGVALRLAS